VTSLLTPNHQEPGGEIMIQTVVLGHLLEERFHSPHVGAPGLDKGGDLFPGPYPYRIVLAVEQYFSPQVLGLAGKRTVTRSIRQLGQQFLFPPRGS
jgi:hypothetical protein